MVCPFIVLKVIWYLNEEIIYASITFHGWGISWRG